MTTEKDPAEIIADAVGDTVDQLNVEADIALQAAEERAEDAERAAAAIADGARHNALVEAVTRKHEEMDGWRGEIHERLSSLQSTTEQTAAHLTNLPASIAEMVRAELKAAASTPSILEPPSSPINPSEAEGAHAEAATNQEAANDPPVQKVVKNLRRAL